MDNLKESRSRIFLINKCIKLHVLYSFRNFCTSYVSSMFNWILKNNRNPSRSIQDGDLLVSWLKIKVQRHNNIRKAWIYSFIFWFLCLYLLTEHIMTCFNIGNSSFLTISIRRLIWSIRAIVILVIHMYSNDRINGLNFICRSYLLTVRIIFSLHPCLWVTVGFA